MSDEIDILRRALERERAARKQAEALLEQKSRELFDHAEASKRVLELLVAERTRELEEARDQALEASRAKSQFLANMSHELRTPLNAILGYGEMLAEDAAADGRAREAEDLGKIQAAGRHLLALINDILDLSKIEAGQLAVFPEDADLGALVDEVVATMRPVVEKNQNRFTLRVDGRLGEGRVDVTKLRQTLFNLLGNAAKFTKDGEVLLSARRAGSRVELSIRDTGIGMSADQVAQLFQPFRQAAPETARKYGGTGLGLAISQRFAQLMGGDIRVESAPGRGSTFTLELPVGEARREGESEPPPPSRAAAGGDRGVVLVIDDDPAARELLVRVLAGEGFAAVAAHDGQQGLELARALRPVAITLDVVMPKVDGWSVLSSLKSDPRLSEVPVIVVSVLGDRALGMSLGAAEVVQKPIERDRLARLLDRHVGPRSTVLVVDDEADARERLARAVRELGHEPLLCASGQAALEALSVSRPALILLDLLMPELDGFGVLERLAAHPTARDVPVVIVTAKDLSAEERAQLAGHVSTIVEKQRASAADLATLVGRLARRPAERG